MNLKNYLKILIYVSLIFLVIYLYKHGLLTIPRIYSPTSLIISLFFLFSGFLIDAWGWKLIVSDNETIIKYKTALISNGLYIFTKYIPGKVWIILGRAGYCKNFTKWNIAELGSFSFIYQLITLSAGMAAGICGIFMEGYNQYIKISAILFLLLLLILTFSGIFNITFKWLSKKIIKKDYNFLILSKLKLLHVFCVSLLIWISWSLGFYFFILALTPNFHFSPIIGLGFPFATVAGIIAVIAPGGIGVREGILTGYLKFTTLSAEYATTVSVFSRIWFLTGELFIFICALFMKTIMNKTQ